MRRFFLLPLILWASLSFGANKFVWSGATGLNDGSAWEDAYTSGCKDWGAEAGFTPSTDFVYVRSSHSETVSGGLCTINGSDITAGTAVVRVLSVAGADTGTAPGALTAGAAIAVSGAGNSLNLYDYLYVHGVNLSYTTGGTGIIIADQATEDHIILESLTITLQTGTLRVGAGTGQYQVTIWRDVDLDIQTSTTGIELKRGYFLWEKGSLVSNIDDLFLTSGPSLRRTGFVKIRGVDFSIFQGSFVQANAAIGSVVFEIEKCRVHANTSLVDGAVTAPGMRVILRNSEAGTSSNPALQMELHDWNGSTTLDTARTRAGGSSQAGVGFSWSLNSGAGAGSRTSRYEPHRGPPVYFWLDGNGSTAKTIKFFLAAGGSLNDDEMWIGCFLQDDASNSSLWKWVTSRPAPLTSGSALATNSATWGGTDVGTKMEVSVTHTPDKSGIAACWPFLAKDAERVSFDVKPDIS